VARPTYRALIAALFFAAAAHAQQAFNINGYLTARGVNASGPASWLEHGFGRLEAGGDRNEFFADAHVGADWNPVSWFAAHASGLARREPSGFAGKRAGLVDAYVELHNEHWQLRAGQFFLGTSRENIGPLWSSPYTLSFSALNTWIGEEVRPVGVDLQWKPNFYVTAGATAFRNNDTAGALLAWRGWTVGNRLTVYNEVLPLPPLFSLSTGGFADQRSDGTVPFETDLDKRTGYAGRVRVQLPERANLQLTHFDNRGDRKEYRDEYAWQTRFDVLGGQVGVTSPTTLAAEYLRGKTGMGAPPIFVDADISAWYVLVSHKMGHERFSARYDGFATEDRDRAPAETNTENGHSWCLAWLHDINDRVRLGAEFVQVTGDRIAAAQSGFNPNTDGHTVTVELRYSF
jgi:hypothetical protein